MAREKKIFPEFSVLLLWLAVLLLTLPSSPHAGEREELKRKGYVFSEEDYVKSAGKGDISALRMFLAAGMNINSVDEEGDTALTAAVRGNHRRALEFLLTQKADPNDTSGAADTANPPAFIHAAANGKLELVRLFLKYRADPNLNWEDGEASGNVLNAAVRSGKTEVVRVLLEHGANPNAEIMDQVGMSAFAPSTALTVARKKGFAQIEKLLLENGGEDRIPEHILAGSIDSLNRKLTREDFRDSKKSDLRIIRNTILAKYGYQFKSADLQKHFARFHWYRKGANKTAIAKLTGKDKANIELIRRMENRR